MRVLVTGYGGFLGSAICRLLVDHGFEVRGLARNSYPELVALGVDPWQGDIACEETVLAACCDCQAVIHTAAKAGVWGAWNEYFNTNTLATQNLLQAAMKLSVKAFVYTSSPSVTFGGEPQSGVDESAPYPTRWLCHYPHTKALGEQAVTTAAIAGKIFACSLRPHLIWGEGDPHLFPRVIARAKAGKLRRVGSGRNLIDVVHVSNAARAHVLALRRLIEGDQRLNGQSLFITDGRPIECWQWISSILTTAGLDVPSGSITFRAAYTLGALLESLYKAARRRIEPPMTRFVAAQLALDHYFSIQRARELLAYEPRVDPEVQLSHCQAWLSKLAGTKS